LNVLASATRAKLRQRRRCARCRDRWS
jgi:hypothetical protein